jgi:23S rRNA pseudouridine955/2504/2580 synthase
MSNIQAVTVTGDEDGIRLDRWFRRHFADLSHGRLEKLLRTGQVRVDGGRSKSSTRLEAGQVVRVPPLGPPRGQPAKKHAPPAFSESELKSIQAMVIHRDDDVLAINKPPGLAVQGGSGLKQHLDAMLDGLRFGEPERPRLVHRLDKDTSGVMVLARNSFAATKLAAAFRGRDAEKVYWALVVGAPRPRTGKIVSELAKSGGKGNQKMTETEDGGLRAVTEYTVIDEAGDRVAWLSLRPQTGRTHQLRVHCAKLGTPILGDGKYGGREAFVDGIAGPLLMHLHARSLRIPHPRSGILALEAPLPEAMLATWKFLGFDTNSAARS